MSGQEGPHRLGRGVLEEWAPSVEGLGERDRAGADAEIGVDPLFEDGLGARADRAGQGDRRTTERSGQAGDPDGSFAEGAGGVERSLAGQAEVGALEPIRQADGAR